MYSFKIVAFLFTCLFNSVVINGRALKDRTAVLKNKTTWKIYLEDSVSRMVMTAERNGKISDCYISGDNYVIAIALQTISSSGVMKLDRKTMNSLITYCTHAKWNRLLGSSGKEVYQELGMWSGMLIYPGTKWCGAGNVSESYDDLGPEVETDKCCRDHDHCPDYIEAFGSNHGLDNNSPFTKSHCQCDEKFYECLREANTQSSNRVGKIFFNYIRMECFKLEHPIRSCSKYKGGEEVETWIRNRIKIHASLKRYIRPRCIDYDLDEEQEPVWQFFDAKEYRPIDEEEFKSAPQDAFDYMLSPSSDISNQTSVLENKDQITDYLMNMSLKNIVSHATKQPGYHEVALSQKTK